METKLPVVGADASEGNGSPKDRQVTQAKMTTLEIVSDPGEGAQKCAQTFGAVSAKMGNGVWTVEIIPAEVQPPPDFPPAPAETESESDPSPSRIGETNPRVIVALNEQVLLARHRLGALEDDAVVLLENMWKDPQGRGHPAAVGGCHGGTLRHELPDHRGSHGGGVPQDRGQPQAG